MSDERTSDVCYAHMIVDGHVIDPQTVSDVSRFRVSQRRRLYSLRKQLTPKSKASMSRVVADLLDHELGSVSGTTISVYWPIRGELNLREWMSRIHVGGALVVLPVVVAIEQPVEFHKWSPEASMKRGFWNIPVPDSEIPVQPDIVIVPLLGVDEARYRLGNGGGYYDRTLSRMPDTTRIIGVGHDCCRMNTIFPMPWDIPMDKVILGDGSVF